MHRKTRTLWIGCCDREFTRIADWIRASTEVTFLPTPSDGPSPPVAPELVLVAITHPSQVAARDIRRLQDRWPRARLVCVLGEWCCGLMRIAPELEAVRAVYTHDLTVRAQLRDLISEVPCEDHAAVRPSNWGGTQLAVIWSPSPEFRRSIGEALGEIGVKIVQMHPHHPIPTIGVDCIVWDIPGCERRQRDELNVLGRRFPEAKIIAITTYPRDSDRERLRAAHVEVLARPFKLSHLFSFFRLCQDVTASSAA